MLDWKTIKDKGIQIKYKNQWYWVLRVYNTKLDIYACSAFGVVHIDKDLLSHLTKADIKEETYDKGYIVREVESSIV